MTGGGRLREGGGFQLFPAGTGLRAARRDCSFFVDGEIEASGSLSLLSPSGARPQGLDQPSWAPQLSAVVEVAEVISSSHSSTLALPLPAQGSLAHSCTQGQNLTLTAELEPGVGVGGASRSRLTGGSGQESV